MARWTIDQPTTRTLDGIVALRVRIVGGHVNILPTDDPVTFEVSDVSGEPVLATQEAGILTITYEDLTGSGLLDRLRPAQLSGYRGMSRRSATVSLQVPRDCPVEVTTLSAPVVAAGLSARTQLRTASGDVTLDGLTARSTSAPSPAMSPPATSKAACGSAPSAGRSPSPEAGSTTSRARALRARSSATWTWRRRAGSA